MNFACPKILIFTFTHLNQHRASKTLQHVITCGSGSDFFLDYAKVEYHLANTGDSNLLYRAISLNYIILCNLLGIERLSLETIRKYWDAGFEMIIFNGERFVKMDDVTFILWKGTVDLNTEKYEITPFLTMNYKYYNDTLLITASDFKSIQGYAVLPFDKRKEDVDQSKFPKKPNFNSNKICCSYILEFSNGRICTPAFFVESEAYPGTVTIELNEDGGIQIMVHKETEEFIISSIRKLLDENRITR